jgi:DNA-binding NtrC family response regulator
MGSGKHEALQARKGGLIGLSAQMQRVYRRICQAGAYDCPVLLTGEKGTEKELAAHAIHAMGPGKKHPFVAVDCPSLPPTLMESELFGYAKGTFFSASETKWGRLAFAGEGTVFLNEVACLPLDFQGKLLRALQEGKFLPIGSVHPLPFVARVIAATVDDLSALVKAGVFREDLFIQLALMSIRLPALRERKGDIPLLSDLFAERHAKEANAGVKFSAAAMEYLMSYRWPGNVQELEETVRRAVSEAAGRVIEASDLSSQSQTDASLPGQREVPLSLDDIERAAIRRALRQVAGDETAAARLLRTGRSTLARKLRYHGLPGAGLHP